jgi:hypothetical protein
MNSTCKFLYSNNKHEESFIQRKNKINRMKKIISILIFSLTVGFYSCSEFEPGGTATKNISGDWYVRVYEADSAGVVGDPIVDYKLFTTYNTAANVPTEFFMNDNAEWWHYYGKVKCDANNYSFGSITDTVANLSYPSNFIIYGGKVMKGVGRSFSGVKTDSIKFYVKFDDDTQPYANVYFVAGHRKTGYLEDLL